MNWTGGRLNRAAGKGENSVVKKQKQHFAKVRSRALQGQTANSPAKWSIFDNITVEVKRKGAPSRQDSESSRQRHRSPDKHHRRTHDIQQPIHEQDSRKRRQRESPELYESRGHGHVTSRPSPDREAKRVKVETYDDSRWQQERGSLEGHKSDDEREEIRRKKLRILRDGDWLGLTIQEPVKLKYAPTGREDKIGRRRRLKPNEHARYDKKQSHISPLSRPRGTQSEVRVCIDGRERRVGASSTVPSRSTRPLSSAASSDLMLLDRSSVKDAFERPPNEAFGNRPFNEEFGSYENFRPSGLQMQGQAGHGYKSTTDSTPVRKHHSTRHGNHAPLTSSSIRKAAEQRQDEEMERIRQNASERLAALARPSPTPVVGVSIDNASMPPPVAQNGRLIFRSSPPPLHHPTPRSSQTSGLLRSDSSELMKSIAATVGVEKRMTTNEEKEDDMWKGWLDENAGDAMAEDDEDDEEPQAPQISPGISTYAPLRREPSLALSLHDSTTTRTSTARSRLSESSFKENRQPAVVETAKLPEVKKISADAAWKSFVLTSSTDDAVAAKPNFHSTYEAPKLQQLPFATKPQHKKSDPDAAWKSFVISESDSDDDKTTFGSFWKKSNKKTQPTVNPLPLSLAPNQSSSSRDSLQVHTSGTTNEPELPFSKPAIHTPLKTTFQKPRLPSSSRMFVTSDPAQHSEAETRILDDRSMYANASATTSTTDPEVPFSKPSIHTPRKAKPIRSRKYGAFLTTSEDDYDGPTETEAPENRSMYANQSGMSVESESSAPVPAPSSHMLLDPFKAFFAKTSGKPKTASKVMGTTVAEHMSRSIYDIPSDD